MTRWIRSALLIVCSALFFSADVQAQSAVALAQAVYGFGNSARVLMIGAHPDDEDTQLITWLARGRQIETAYLSLTRGDGGQNIIGNELGEALGAIRTEELLAARRLDGGHQYFTRAFDFGFSKDSAETLTHWPREAILGDVVKVVRAFRPHVIVAVWSGTAADGHGHHVVAGVFAKDAYELAGDTVRFPVDRFGAAWTPAKFYRVRRNTPTNGALRIDVGEFNPLIGKSYAEIATDSRTQHKSQGQGSLAPPGSQWNYVLREATRVNATTPAAQEHTIFDGIDTTWARFRSVATTAAQRALIDSMPALSQQARDTFAPRVPAEIVPVLARAASLLEAARNENGCRYASVGLMCSALAADFGASIEVAHERIGDALLGAASVRIDAFADREYFAQGDTASVSVTVVNRGKIPVTVQRVDAPNQVRTADTNAVVVPPDSVGEIQRLVFGTSARGAAWWIDDRSGLDVFPDLTWQADGTLGRTRANRDVPSVSGFAVAEDRRLTTWLDARIDIAGATYTRRVGPFVHRSADAVDGETRRPVVPIAGVSLLFDRTMEVMRANQPVDRVIRMRVRSYSTHARAVKFTFRIPDGLRADNLPDTLTIAPLESRDIAIHVRGKVDEGPHEMTALATEGRNISFTSGAFTLDYAHIRPIVLKRPSGLWVTGVDVAIPSGVRIAYVPGVSDDVSPILQQLDLPVTNIEPAQLGSADLSVYQVVVLGPRVYAKAPILASFNDKLAEFAKQGGTVIVQYGQTEMASPGMLPYSVQYSTPAQRVTLENAPVTIIDPGARLLQTPNKIDTTAFSGWIQERALYMPSVADAAWKTVFEMHDPGEPPNKNGLLIAPVGRGTYVYTTMSFLRQIPVAHAGAIRLFVNLIALGQRAPAQ